MNELKIIIIIYIIIYIILILILILTMIYMTYNIQTEEYKTATTCGILVKNIFEKDYGNWRLEDNLQITYLMKQPP